MQPCSYGHQACGEGKEWEEGREEWREEGSEEWREKGSEEWREEGSDQGKEERHWSRWSCLNG